MRLNARLDDEEWEKKIRYLLEKSQLSQTDLIKTALNLLYRAYQAKEMPSFDQVMDAGFVGGAEGPENLSGDYKKILHESLARKHDHY